MSAIKKEVESVIHDIDISEVLHNSMMPYSEYVILDRALPRVEDGLKPVQRRILYAMLELGTTPDKPYRKSARVVGDCLGKYHPHGDSSVYGAMVRMAQTFNMSSTLIDGQGNFGSIDGDPAAAMRYTEVRLQPLAMEMLRDIDKDTVDWSLNFDDTLKEPDTLPGRFPNLLVNGASGIAVGLATNIPPHNICEVIDGVCAYIDNPKITLDEMMTHIKAPDFPTGAELIVGDDLKKAYETGKGKVGIRAKAYIEKDGDKYSIVITELPYQVNKANLLREIDKMREGNRKEIFGNIADIIDESDRKIGMRAVIKIKKEGNPRKILEALYKYTDLEQNFNINMVAIADGKPQQLGLLDLVKYYVNYQKQIIYRRSQYELALAKEREHILQGIIIAIENIDEVIKIIKSSASTTDCKAKLRARFDISEKQAQAILDIRLARLTKLEVNNLRLEIAELQEKIAYLTEVVKSNKKQLSIVKDEIREIRKKYRVDRRSQIFINGVEQKIEIEDINEVEEKKGYALLSKANNIKFLTEKAYKSANKIVNGASLNDIMLRCVACDNQKPIYLFTNKGNFAIVSIDSLGNDRWTGKGSKPSNIVSEFMSDEKVIAIFTEEELSQNKLLFMTKNGMVKLSNGSEYIISKKVSNALVLKDNDEVLKIELKNDEKSIIMVTRDGIVLNMESNVPCQGRKSSGVIGISLRENDEVVYSEQIDDEGEIIIITDKGYGKRVIAGFIKLLPRNRKGVKIQDFNGKNGSKVVFGAHVKYPFDIALIGENDEVAGVNSEELNIENMTSRGKQIKNLVGNIKSGVACSYIESK